MSRLAPLAFAPLLGLAGCLPCSPSANRIPLVKSAPGVPSMPRPERLVSTAPAMKASSERVLQVGQRLILANPQLGLRPLFITVGVPQPEVFHKGGSLGGCQVVVSEGIVRACPSDAELAAVLALELGKIVAERVALASPASRQGNDRPPLERVDRPRLRGHVRPLRRHAHDGAGPERAAPPRAGGEVRPARAERPGPQAARQGGLRAGHARAGPAAAAAGRGPFRRSRSRSARPTCRRPRPRRRHVDGGSGRLPSADAGDMLRG